MEKRNWQTIVFVVALIALVVVAVMVFKPKTPNPAAPGANGTSAGPTATTPSATTPDAAAAPAAGVKVAKASPITARPGRDPFIPRLVAGVGTVPMGSSTPPSGAGGMPPILPPAGAMGMMPSSEAPLMVTGIIWNHGHTAIIRKGAKRYFVRAGDKVEQYRVRRIVSNQVVLAGGGEQLVLILGGRS